MVEMTLFKAKKPTVANVLVGIEVSVGAPQGTKLGPLQLLSYVNVLQEYVGGHRKFKVINLLL